MKSLVFGFVMIASLTASASPDPSTVKAVLEAQPVCQNFVRFDDQNLYLGFGAYRRAFEEPRLPIPAALVVAPLHSGVAFPLITADAAIDAVSAGSHLFVLTYSGIEEWDLANQKRLATHPTHDLATPLAYQEHPRAFARAGDVLVIAHGRWGVSFFDLKTKSLIGMMRLIPRQAPLESMATGVTVHGTTAYVVMDNFSLVRNGKPAFRGVVQIDMNTRRVTREMDGLDPFATSITTNGRDLVIGFGGDPLWIYDLAKFGGRELPEPRRRQSSFEPQGHPVGSGVLDAKFYHTCYLKDSGTPGRRTQLSPLSLEL